MALLSRRGAGSAEAQAKARIAVVNFANNSTWSWWGDNLGAAAADEMTTQLVKGGQFTVLERAQIGAILAEQNLGASGAVTAATAPKVGKLLGVQFWSSGRSPGSRSSVSAPAIAASADLCRPRRAAWTSA